MPQKLYNTHQFFQKILSELFRTEIRILITIMALFDILFISGICALFRVPIFAYIALKAPKRFILWEIMQLMLLVSLLKMGDLFHVTLLEW